MVPIAFVASIPALTSAADGFVGVNVSVRVNVVTLLIIPFLG